MYSARSVVAIPGVRETSREYPGAGRVTEGSPRSRAHGMSHSHSHSHGGGHSHDDAWPDDDWNLHQHVERAEALNGRLLIGDEGGDEGVAMLLAASSSTGKAGCVLKPHARRLDRTHALSSDADEQLMVKLQFNVPVSVRKIMVVGAGPSHSHPNSVRCYVGRAAEDLDFAVLEEVAPAQVAELAINDGEGYFNTARAPFTNITALALFFPSNHGDVEETKISYIGMQVPPTPSRSLRALSALGARAAPAFCVRSAGLLSAAARSLLSLARRATIRTASVWLFIPSAPSLPKIPVLPNIDGHHPTCILCPGTS